MLLTLVFAVSLMAFACDARSGECLSYEPAKVKVAGTLTRKMLPGPPEYESIEKGDWPVTYWILRLSKTMCVEEDPDDEINTLDIKDVRKMHLVISADDYSRYELLLNKKVVVTGVLRHIYARYEQTMVLEVDDMKLAKNKGVK